MNREILDTAPAMFLSMLDYKAEEAGSRVVYLNTRKLKPSQACPSCGVLNKKPLSMRMHVCLDCNFVATRDQASSLYMLTYWQKSNGQELATRYSGNPLLTGVSPLVGG